MTPPLAKVNVLGPVLLTGWVVCAVGALPMLAQSPAAASNGTARRLAELRHKVLSDNRDNPVQALALEDAALALLGPGGDPAEQAWFLRMQVRDAATLNDFNKATAALARGREVTANLGDEREQLLLEVQGAQLAEDVENPGDAKLILDPLVPRMEAYVKRTPGDSEFVTELGRTYQLRGTVLRDLGRFSDAIASYQQGHNFCERHGNKAGQARILAQMGTLYALIDRLDDAIASHRASIALAETTGDRKLQAYLHLNLANTLGYREETDGQLAELKLAADLAAQTNYADVALTAAVNLADAYLRKKDYRATLRFADQALKLAQTAHNPSSVAVSQVNRGVALNRLGNPAEGLKAIQEGLAHFKATQGLTDAAEITGVLAEEYAFAGDYRRAYDTEVEFKRLSDDLKKAKDLKHIADASAAFENDKNQLQIQALQRDRHNLARLRLLWAALGTLGFGTAGVLVLGMRKLKAANSQLADMSLRDPLTSLANRRYLTTRIAEDLAQAHRMQRSGVTENTRNRLLVNIDVIFFMIDIDHFKRVNDQYGHVAGDQVLKQFAFILRQAMRDSDTVVRWGGEEFFVVAKQTSRADAHVVAERLRTRVEEFPFDLGNGLVIHKTCSIGFSSYPFFRKNPGKVSWEKVAEVADQCLFAAKTMGRNTWVGVHENEAAEPPFQELGDAYPDVAEMVEHGILRAESRNNQPIVWMG